MRAIGLYAEAVADCALEGRASGPDVPVGEDEFVELDEGGNPRAKKAAPGGRRRPAPAAAAVKRKAPARRPSLSPVEDAGAAGDEPAAE